MKKTTVTLVTYEGFAVKHEAHNTTVSNGLETFEIGFFSDREASDLLKMMKRGVSFKAAVYEILRSQTQRNVPTIGMMEMIREDFASRWMFGKKGNHGN